MTSSSIMFGRPSHDLTGRADRNECFGEPACRTVHEHPHEALAHHCFESHWLISLGQFDSSK